MIVRIYRAAGTMPRPSSPSAIRGSSGLSRLTPDGRVYHGSKGVWEFWRGWAGTFDDFDFRIEKIVDAGGGEVVVRCHQAGTGRGSGAAVDFYFGQVWTVGGGKIEGFRAFPDFEQALEAAGLSE